MRYRRLGYRRLTPILLAALLLRLYFLQDYIAHHSRQALGAIPFLFEPGNIAFSLVNGHGFASPFRIDTGPTAWMTPVWPVLLALIFRVFGSYTFNAFLVTALLNVLFSALTCIPLFFAGRRVGGTGVAITATCLWAVFPNAIVLSYESLWEQSLAALLAATILWAALALQQQSRPIRDWCGYGLLWGVSLLTSAALFSLLPPLLGWLAWRRGAARAALAGVVAILCCIPWTVRNYLTLHAMVPLRSVAGLALWVGNNDQADGLSTRLHPISNSSERARYVEIGEISYMREKRAQALDFMFSHPMAELRLTATRFLATWTGGSTNPLMDFLRTRSGRVRWTLFWNVFAAISAAAGVVVLFLKHPGRAFPVAVFPLLFPIPYYLSLAMPRYRHPIDPAVLLLAAFTLQAIWQTIGRRGLNPPNSIRTTDYK